MTPLERIELLPVHVISGYEWECDTCHYHFGHWDNGERVPEVCRYCGDDITADNDCNYFDPSGRACDHRDLLSREAVLDILKEAA